MVTVDEVAEMSAALPGVVVAERHGNRAWSVGSKAFVWERPFSKADLKRFGDAQPPDGPVVAVRVADLHEKEAVLAAGRRGVFTIPHFDNYPAVLVQLSSASKRTVREIIIDAWLACAPADLATTYLGQRRQASE